MYTGYEEHDVILNESFYDDITLLLNKVDFPCICIVSYLTCSNDVVRKILENSNIKFESRIRAVCVEYDPFSTVHLVVNLLNDIRNTGYTHVILLLNGLDVEQIVQRLNFIYIQKTKFIITSQDGYLFSENFPENISVLDLSKSAITISKDLNVVTNKTVQMFSMLFSENVSYLNR